MARRSSKEELSISQLEQMLAGRKARLSVKVRERDRLMSRLEKLDEEIQRLGGAAAGAVTRGGGRRKRARNEKSLVATLEDVLKSGKPMKVGDITAAALKSGYRSNSASFRNIVNQTLIKDKRFSAASRGTYQLKKAG